MDSVRTTGYPTSCTVHARASAPANAFLTANVFFTAFAVGLLLFSMSSGGRAQGRPFRTAVWVGDFLYLSGSLDAEGAKAGLGIEAQTKNTMDRLGLILAEHELDFSHVVRSNVYLQDSRYFAAMNAVYRTYFTDKPPTRATVEADLALPRALVEIAFVAVRDSVETKAIVPEGWSAPTNPYSWAIQAGDTLFISGMVSRDPEAALLVTGDVSTQTQQVLKNIGQVLEAAGMSYADVVTSHVFLAEARDFADMNTTYRRCFSAAGPPARATVRARLMNPDLNVEIQCLAVRDSNRRVVSAAGAPPNPRPFSPAILAGNRLFLAGMVGRGPGGFAPGDVEAQTRRTLANLAATMTAAGVTFENVVESSVYLPDVRHFEVMNRVYQEHFPSAPPARTTVGTALMSPEAMIEIMMVADASAVAREP